MKIKINIIYTNMVIQYYFWVDRVLLKTSLVDHVRHYCHFLTTNIGRPEPTFMG